MSSTHPEFLADCRPDFARAAWERLDDVLWIRPTGVAYQVRVQGWEAERVAEAMKRWWRRGTEALAEPSEYRRNSRLIWSLGICAKPLAARLLELGDTAFVPPPATVPYLFPSQRPRSENRYNHLGEHGRTHTLADAAGGWFCGYCSEPVIDTCEDWAWEGRRYRVKREYRGRIGVVDHVIPKSKGGTNHIENLTLACWTCNARKGAKLPSEWVR